VLSVLEAREAHPRWGPKKLGQHLRRKLGDDTPSRATVARILARFGLVRHRRRRPERSVVESAPDVTAKECNDVWTVDLKGWWSSGDGSRCEPLTVRDAFSRYVLASKLVPDTTTETVRPVFEALFRRYGLPRAIQCDNGSPFISVRSPAGLTRLSAWLVSLGIQLIRSRPGCPQDNGGHERMHRDLSDEVQAFPSVTWSGEQRAIERWRQEFNHVRPHDALDGKTPAEVYRPSSRRSLRPVRWSHPRHWLVRKVTPANGRVWIGGVPVRVGKALGGHRIALEPLSEGHYRAWFGNLDLGELKVGPTTREVDRVAIQFLRRRTQRRKRA
jgi:transposase InsO family protein